MHTRPAFAHKPPSGRGFTLLEMLVVIAIVGALAALLLAAVSVAHEKARTVSCSSNLRQIGIALVLYNATYSDYVVPSYNLPWAPGATHNRNGGPYQVLDGWAPILDRDGFVPCKEKDTNTIFYCPDTLDVEGMKDGQTGTDPRKPQGWTDWPLRFTSVGGDSSPKVATTIPELRFNKIIRVSYWINAYNPIGNTVDDIAPLDLYYTSSVGWGPDGTGKFVPLHTTARIRNPQRLIVLADGIYMGRQEATHLGEANSRIGYRHMRTHDNGYANVAYADGHVGRIDGRSFPRAAYPSRGVTVEMARSENLYGDSTVYADPTAALGK